MVSYVFLIVFGDPVTWNVKPNNTGVFSQQSWESHVFLIMVEQNIYVDRLDIYAGLSGYPAANGRSCLELWLYPLP